MLKKVIQQGRRRRNNRKRTLRGTLRIVSSRERSWWPFSASCEVLPMDDAMHGQYVVLAIDRIENAPVADRVLGHTGQVWCNGLMAKVGDVGSQPFGFVEQSLGEVFLERR